MVTEKQARKRIDEIMARADAELQALADEVREQRVAPICKRKGWTFSSGMGTFSFFDRNGYPIEESKNAELEPLFRTLNLEVWHGQYLGFWVRDVSQ